jgi:hypothetical protein
MLLVCPQAPVFRDVIDEIAALIALQPVGGDSLRHMTSVSSSAILVEMTHV